MHAHAELIIQKAYTPQNGAHYFEIMNNSNTMLDAGCYSLVTHFQDIYEEGFFVVKLPALSLQPREVITIGSDENLNPVNPLNKMQLGWSFLSQNNFIQKFVLSENQMQLNEMPLPPAKNFTVGNVFRSDLEYVEHVVLLLKGSTLVDASVTVDADKNLPSFLDRLPAMYFDNTCGTRVSLTLNGMKNRYPNIFNRPNLPNEYGYFKEFEVQRNSTAVQIAWQTMREQNNRGFYIERRTGSGPWTTVAYVATQAPEGNSNESLQYYYGDKSILNTRTEYRLRQMDVNGRAHYSPSRPIDAEGRTESIVVYPNPSPDGRANIAFGPVNALRDVQVLDINGQLLQQWVSVNSRSQQLQNLRSGQYFIRVIERQTGAVYTEKLIVSNH